MYVLCCYPCVCFRRRMLGVECPVHVLRACQQQHKRTGVFAFALRQALIDTCLFLCHVLHMPVCLYVFMHHSGG